MSKLTLTPQEICQRGQEIYERELRVRLDNEENSGKVLLIDTESGTFEMDMDHVAASDRLRARRPEAKTFAMRIGYPTLGKVGGGWKMVSQP